MIQLISRAAVLSKEQLCFFEKLHALVPKEFRPLIRPARELQAKILGIEYDAIESLRPAPTSEFRLIRTRPETARFGEVFSDAKSLFVVSITESKEQGLRLQAYYIGHDSTSASFGCFEEIVNKAFEVTLKESPYVAKRFDELKIEGRASPIEPTSEERSGAQVLMDRAVRAAAVAIKSSGGLLVSDIEKQLPPGAKLRVEDIIGLLGSRGIIDSEVVSICRKNQAQTARVDSREMLDEMSQNGLRCACGRAIAEERVEEAVTITQRGRALLDGSRWLTILVLEELRAVGIPLDRILVEQQVGGDEIDCLADINGEVALFELKDKEFNLGNAYSFGAKIGIIQPHHSIVVSTEHVGGDAKDHFQRAIAARGAKLEDFYDLRAQRGDEIIYIEGLDRLREGIRALAESINVRDARSVLGRVLGMVSIDPGAIVEAFRRIKPVPA
jgi:hypothetical protein